METSATTNSLPGMRRLGMYEHLPILTMALAVGVVGGYGAVFFRFVIKYTQFAFYRDSRDILEFAGQLAPWILVAMPTLGGLIVGLLVQFGASETKGHGVPEVMEAVALNDGQIRKRVALIKILASAVSIGSGGSVGREGPIVQIGSGIGSTVGQLFKVSRQRQKTLVGCGAAAGIAATFNAPIAGVLFSLEIILGDWGMTSFSPVVLSSVLATTISRHYFGDFPAFIVPAYEVRSGWEFLIYPLLGLLAGVLAVVFISTLYKSEDLWDAIRMPEFLKPACGGLLLGCILLRWPHVFGVGYGAINLALTNEIPLLLLVLLIGLKILATSLTIGSGGSGGVFAPSLFIGAMTGGFFGNVAGHLLPGLTAHPGAYALVAMGALVAGATQAPITAILIIFELTNDYKIILPLMLSCIISTLVASILKNGSIYTLKLLRRGVDISGGMEQNILRAMKVGEQMRTKVATVGAETPMGTIIKTFKAEDVSYLHVVNKHGLLVGIISFRDIRKILDDPHQIPLLTARDIATREVVTVTPADTIQRALHLMADRGISQLPVVSEEHQQRLLGALSEKDLIGAYDKAIIEKGLTF